MADLVGNQWRSDGRGFDSSLSDAGVLKTLCGTEWKAVLRALTAHWRICVAAAAAGFSLMTRTLMDALVCVYVCFLFFSPKSLFTSKRDGWSQPAEHLGKAKNNWVEALRPCSRALPKKKKIDKKTICLQVERTWSQFDQDWKINSQKLHSVAADSDSHLISNEVQLSLW